MRLHPAILGLALLVFASCGTAGRYQQTYQDGVYYRSRPAEPQVRILSEDEIKARASRNVAQKQFAQNLEKSAKADTVYVVDRFCCSPFASFCFGFGFGWGCGWYDPWWGPCWNHWAPAGGVLAGTIPGGVPAGSIPGGARAGTLGVPVGGVLAGGVPASVPADGAA